MALQEIVEQVRRDIKRGLYSSTVGNNIIRSAQAQESQASPRFISEENQNILDNPSPRFISEENQEIIDNPIPVPVPEPAPVPDPEKTNKDSGDRVTILRVVETGPGQSQIYFSDGSAAGLDTSSVFSYLTGRGYSPQEIQSALPTGFDEDETDGKDGKDVKDGKGDDGVPTPPILPAEQPDFTQRQDVTLEDILGTRQSRNVDFQSALDRAPGLGGGFQRFLEQQQPDLEDQFLLQRAINPQAPSNFSAFLSSAGGGGIQQNQLQQLADLLKPDADLSGLEFQQTGALEALGEDQARQFDIALQPQLRQLSADIRAPASRVAGREFQQFLLDRAINPLSRSNFIGFSPSAGAGRIQQSQLQQFADLLDPNADLSGLGLQQQGAIESFIGDPNAQFALALQPQLQQVSGDLRNAASRVAQRGFERFLAQRATEPEFEFLPEFAAQGFRFR